ncbi:hypothetical protein RRG08_021107 [Elysia crispata]|uniref:Uncharacterized protein n=1 Tax=Elysia crispata TaxID=231223 RepID=A0AAE0Z5Q0_9GAST|nr:hypothetical protein RRG08_021107 [Elysia crispata]
MKTETSSYSMRSKRWRDIFQTYNTPYRAGVEGIKGPRIAQAWEMRVKQIVIACERSQTDSAPLKPRMRAVTPSESVPTIWSFK